MYLGMAVFDFRFLLFEIVDHKTGNNRAHLDRMCEERTKGQAYEVINDPKQRVEAAGGTVTSTVFLTDAKDKGKRCHHCDEIGNMLEHQHIDGDKGNRVNHDQPYRQFFILPLEKVIDDRLSTANEAGCRTCKCTGQHIARCYQNICGKHEQQDRLHIFAFKKRRNADTNSTEQAENKS